MSARAKTSSLFTPNASVVSTTFQIGWPRRLGSSFCSSTLVSVTVPATGRLCNLGCATDHHSLLLLFSFTNEVLVQGDLMWYWKATAAYKTDAYILPKLLGEKVALPLGPSCGRFGAHRPHTGALCFSILRSVRRNFTCQQTSNMVPVTVLPFVNFPSRAIPEMFQYAGRSSQSVSIVPCD